MTIEQKESVIAKIAKTLNESGAVWGVGASYMLYKRGVVADFNDFDIVVEQGAGQQVDTLLRGMGKAVEIEPNAGYETEFFGKYEIEGLGVDLMCGFSVVCALGVFHYLFDEAAAPEKIDVRGQSVPLARLGDWLVLYGLMKNRKPRVDAIRKYYESNPPSANEMLETALAASLGFLTKAEGIERRRRYLEDPRYLAASI